MASVLEKIEFGEPERIKKNVVCNGLNIDGIV